MKTFRDYLILAMGMSLASMATFLVAVRPPQIAMSPRPAATVDGAKLGRAYAASVVATLSDAWVAAADALGRGNSMSEAQSILQQTWQEGRARAFAASVAPDFARTLAEGSEPADDAQRARVVALWKAFARGLKGGR